MEILKMIGVWVLFFVLLVGSALLYYEAHRVKRKADKIYENELKQEKQETDLTWKYRWSTILGVLSGITYFSTYLVAGKILSLTALTVLFCIAFLSAHGVSNFLDKKLSFYIETGKINSVAYLGYLYSALRTFDAFDKPMQIVPTYARLTQEKATQIFSASEAPAWFIWGATSLALFLTVILTLVFSSTALLYVCNAQEYAGYFSVRAAIRKWHLKNLNKIMHRDEFKKVSIALYVKTARKEQVRKILRTFGATSLSGLYFYLRAVFTKVNLAIGIALSGWGLWALAPQHLKETAQQFVAEKILKVQFQEWDSWASIIAGIVLIIGILFAYSRVEKLPPVFRSHNFDKAVEKLSEIYTEYSNLLDIWNKYYETELALHLNDAYQTYLENISKKDTAVSVAGVYKFPHPLVSSRTRDLNAEELTKRLHTIDQKFEEIHNRAEATVIRKFLLEHNLFFGYLKQYRFIDGYSKFSENFELPGGAQKQAEDETCKFVDSYYEPRQRVEKIHAETRSFIERTEINILMTYLRMLEIERTANAIASMHKKSLKEKIAEVANNK